jgi:hypothetical protein
VANVFIKRRNRMVWSVVSITAISSVLGLLTAYLLATAGPRFVSSATAGLVRGTVLCATAGTERVVRTGQTLPLDAGGVLILPGKTDLVILEARGLREGRLYKGPIRINLSDVRGELNRDILAVSRARSAGLLRLAGWILTAFLVFLGSVIVAYRKKSELSNGYVLAVISILFSLMAWFVAAKLARLTPTGDILVFFSANALLTTILSLIITRQKVIPEVQELEDRIADLVFTGYDHLANKDHAKALANFKEALTLNPTMRRIWQMVRILELQDNDPGRFAELLRKRNRLLEKFRDSAGRDEG